MESENPKGASPTNSVPSGQPGDWQARAADSIEATVAAIHDRVIRPLVIFARMVVFGILVATTTLALCVLLSVALVRLLDLYAFPGRVWASEALIGAVLAALGLVAWSFRRARHDTRGG